MKKKSLLGLNLTAAISSILLLAAPAHAFEKTPFTDVLFDEAPYVKVEVDGEVYNLLSIDGVKRAVIMGKCEAAYGAQCACQFSEKFTETMASIGQPVGDSVALRLYRASSHSTQEVEARPVTSGNQEDLRINREIRNEVCFP